ERDRHRDRDRAAGARGRRDAHRAATAPRRRVGRDHAARARAADVDDARLGFERDRTTRAAGVAGERGAVTERADRAGPARRPVDLAPGEHVDAAAGAGVAEAGAGEEVRLRRDAEDGVVVGGDAERADAEVDAAVVDHILEVHLP